MKITSAKFGGTAAAKQQCRRCEIDRNEAKQR
jgi:hypothetical protein